MITLLIVPMAYSLFDDLTTKLRREPRARSSEGASELTLSAGDSTDESDAAT